MSLSAVGISHHTAPIAIRERLAFAAETLPDALRSLAATPDVLGAAIISTCNRTEIYLSSQKPITRAIIDWLHDWQGLRAGQYREHLYQLDHTAVIQHLMKVVSGADSMVIGEPQVGGQVKQAWHTARDLGYLDGKLDRMFQHAFAGAKRVRTDTGIGQNPVTLPYASLRLARQIFGSLDSLRVLMIGAGEMIEDCARHYRQQGIRTLTIANRSLERARQLAADLQAEAIGLEELAPRLQQHDLVLACTGSSTPVLTRAMFQQAITQRRHRPMFALDLAVPRNIEPSSAELSDVFLYTIDDLHAIVESGQRERSAALAQAMEIIESEALVFERWMRLQASSAALKDLRRRAGHERDQLLEQALKELSAGRPAEDVIRRLGHRLVNRMLHGPSTRLRRAAESDDEELLEAARFYFLDED